MFDKIYLCRHLILDFCLLGGSFFSLTDSVSLLVIGLFIFSISSWFSLGNLCISRNLFLSSRLAVLLVCSCLYESFMTICISKVSVVISPFSFLILLIWGL